MQLPSPQHYLMKSKLNITYYFYQNKDRCLAIKTFNNKNQFLEDEILIPQPVLDYSVAIDRNDYIHLICITSDGVLSYYIQQKSKWNHRQISKVDIKSNVYRNLVLLIKNKDIHILCNKTNFTNPAITSIEHMYWNDKNMKKITVTTYLPGKYSSPFQVDADSVGNLHLIYKVLHQKNNQLYYSFFNNFNKKWSNSEIISNLQEDHSHPHILMDRQDNLHLVWCTIEDNNFTLKYKKRIHVSNLKAKWSMQKNLSDKNTNNHSPLLIQEGSILKVISRQNDRFNEIISEDFGTTWRASSVTHGYVSKDLISIKYSTNSDLEKINTSISKVYGEIRDYISIIGINLFPVPIHEVKKQEVEEIGDSADHNDVNEDVNEDINECVNYVNDVNDVNYIKNAKYVMTTKDTKPPEEFNKIEKSQQIENTINPIQQDILTEISEVKTQETLEKAQASGSEVINQNLTVESLTNKTPEEVIEGLHLDDNLKTLVQEVQTYLNKMVIEVEKLEETKKLLQEKSHTSCEDFGSSHTFQQFQDNLSELNHQLSSIEAEEFELQKELDQFQKKIYTIEDRMIQFKKQLLELEDKVMKIPSLQSSLVNRFKSIFK